MGQLAGIAYKTEKYGAMISLESAMVGTGTGVASDYRGIPGKRQVTVLSKEAFEAACNEIQDSLPWTIRRANLMISGIDLENTTGKHLRIGELVLEITGQTEPCFRMDEQRDGLKLALQPQWRGGVTCRVTTGGTITVGDKVMLAD
ncbi:MAG: MOSC domain-containing protein [Bacteroidales bacterium]|nr:MOSC domain-containing protein [Bacteroidales bacterium]